MHSLNLDKYKMLKLWLIEKQEEVKDLDSSILLLMKKQKLLHHFLEKKSMEDKLKLIYNKEIIMVEIEEEEEITEVVETEVTEDNLEEVIEDKNEKINFINLFHF